MRLCVRHAVSRTIESPRMDGWMDEWMGGWLDGWMDGWMKK